MTAKSRLVCYTLTRKSFDSLLGPIQDVWRFEALRKVPILFSLSNSQLFGLAQCMKYHTLQAGQVVFKKGEPGEPIFAQYIARHATHCTIVRLVCARVVGPMTDEDFSCG